MKKALFLTVLLSIGLGVAVAQAVDLTVNDGVETYDATFLLSQDLPFSTGPVALYFVQVRGTTGVGVISYQPTWGAFKLGILEDDEFWGYTLEGHWTGDGSEATGSNNIGVLLERNIYVGELVLKPTEQGPSVEEPDVNRK